MSAKPSITASLLANCQLDGLEANSDTLDDLALFEKGELTSSAFSAYVIDKYQPYYNPQSGILGNTFSILNGEILDQLTLLLLRRKIKLAQNNLPCKLATLQVLNRHLFGYVNPNAGQLSPTLIEPLFEAQLIKLEQDLHCYSQDKIKLIEKISEHYGELSHLKAFEYGNGITLRVFINNILAKEAISLNWQKINKQDYTMASIRAYHGENSLLQQVFQGALQPISDPQSDSSGYKQ